MKLAVVEHRIREDAAADIDALAVSIAAACDRGASVVACPSIPSIVGSAEDVRAALLGRLEGCPEGTALLIPFRETASETVAPVKPTPLGPTGLLLGDECLSPEVLRRLETSRPEALVMRPLSESELQAEAALERALALSLSVAGLVLVAECSGAGFAEPGHGGSAIVLLGEVLAEADGITDVLVVDVNLPVLQPEPREPLPPLPPILEQRLAHHQGRKVEPGYLADLS